MYADLVVKNAEQLVTSKGHSDRPKVKEELGSLEVLENGAVASAGDEIIAVGTTKEVLDQVKLTADTEVIDAAGMTVHPGLVDPHTHIVFGGSREHELNLKLKGVSYLDILAQGGGILSTVKATREASLSQLVDIGMKYADQMLCQGTTTAEAKSGYGLTTEDEVKTLKAIREIDRRHHLDLVPTFLGAHAIPTEYKNDPEAFVDLVIEEMLPAVAEDDLAEYCDVFCEKGVFSVEQSRRILLAAKEFGLDLKLHADEITSLGGAELAAELGAASADHLLVISKEGILRMAEEQVMAVLLPATTFYLKEDHYAPAREMIEAGVPVALASDFNPGSCPNNSLQIVMTIACLYLGMTPGEVMNAITINAAHALGRAGEVGSIEVGKKADLVLFDAPNYHYLPYRFGTNLVAKVVKNGRIVIGGEN